MQQLIHKVVNELRSKISDKYELQEMRVFGSSARGDRRADSDIDVFVQLSRVNRQTEENLFDIAYDLELKYDCLIDLGADTLRSQQQICSVCTRIFANKQGNLAQIVLFETRFTPNVGASS